MSLYTDVRDFVSDRQIIPYEASGRDDFNTTGTYSHIFGYKATIFEPDKIILRYSPNQISEVQVEKGLISFPFTAGISKPRPVCGYTASVYYGLDKRQLYITGGQAQRLFNMVSGTFMNKTWQSCAKKDTEYAQKHYKEIYELMSLNKCANSVQYNGRVKRAESIANEMFNLVAAYIINCEDYKEDKRGFSCKSGETRLFFGEDNDTGHSKTTDQYMNQKFGWWTFCTKSGFISYRETENPYAFAGLAQKFIELADYVHNDGENYMLSPYTLRYLREHHLAR